MSVRSSTARTLPAKPYLALKKAKEHDEECRLPPDIQRNAAIQIQEMSYQDTSDIVVSKNFESSEGIAYCFERKLYLFGGIGRSQDTNVSVFNPAKNVFSTLAVDKKGQYITSRCYHSMTMIGSKIIVFGGELNSRGFGSRFLLNETWMLDLKLRLWTKLKDESNCEIPAIKNHRSCALGGRVVISGGLLDEDIVNPNIYIYETCSNTWKEAEMKVPSWRGRLGHSMTPCYRHAISDIYAKPAKSALLDGAKVQSLQTPNDLKISIEGLYMFGGMDENRRISNDLLIIDTCKRR